MGFNSAFKGLNNTFHCMDYISERGRMMNWERHEMKWSGTIVSYSRISLEILTEFINLSWLAGLTEILSWAL